MNFVTQVLFVLINVCFCLSSSMCRQVVIDMDTGKQILDTPVENVTVKITAEPGTIASIVSASLLRPDCPTIFGQHTIHDFGRQKCQIIVKKAVYFN